MSFRPYLQERIHPSCFSLLQSLLTMNKFIFILTATLYHMHSPELYYLLDGLLSEPGTYVILLTIALIPSNLLASTRLPWSPNQQDDYLSRLLTSSLTTSHVEFEILCTEDIIARPIDSSIKVANSAEL